MDRRRAISHIARSPLFNALTRQQCSALAAVAQESHPSGGTQIVREQGILTKVILVIEGTLQRTIPVRDTHVLMSTLMNGDVWGYETLLSPHLHLPYALTTGNDTAHLLEWPVAIITSLCSRDPGLHRSLVVAAGRELVRTRTQLETLTSVHVSLSATLKETGAAPDLHSMLATICSLVHAERGFIVRFDNAARSMIVDTTHNLRVPQEGTAIPLASDTLLTIVYNTASPLLITRSNFERKFTSAPYWSSSFLAVPLMRGTTVHGALVVRDRSQRAEFSDDDRAVLEAISPIIAYGLEQATLAQVQHAHEVHNRVYVQSFQRK